MKKIVFLLTILCFTLLGQAQTSSKTRIAVFDPITHFQIVDGTDVIVREITSSTVVNSGQYQIIDRRTIEKIQEEQNFTRSGMVSDTHVIEMGELAGAQCVLFSVLAKSGTKTLLTTKLLDVKSGTVLKQKFLLLDLSVDLVTEVEKITKELIGNSFGQSYNYSSNSSYASQSSSGSYSTGETNMTINLPSGDSFVMVYVEGGQFSMGCTNDQQGGCESNESPAHFVTLSDYYIGETEVTQALWQAVMGTSIYQQRDREDSSLSLYGVGSNYPMYYVNYSEIEEFCGRLNNLLRSQLPQGYKFRLPTEAQWEYAARGGKKDRPSLYAGSDYIGEVAWYKGNSNASTHPVKTKEPNELGIYDMSGNVWEWCADWYNSSYYSSSPTNNPKNLSSDSFRSDRGGGWDFDAAGCRVAFRGYASPDSRFKYRGFRLVLVQEVIKTVVVTPGDADIEINNELVAKGKYDIDFERTDKVLITLSRVGYETATYTLLKSDPRQTVTYEMDVDEAYENSEGGEAAYQYANKWVPIKPRKDISEDDVWRRMISIIKDYEFELETTDKPSGWIKTFPSVKSYKTSDVKTTLEVLPDYSTGEKQYKVRLSFEKRSKKPNESEEAGAERWTKYDRLIKVYKDLIPDLINAVGGVLPN